MSNLNPNTMVGCTEDRSCGGSPVTSTIKDCCDHDIDPSGFAYTIPGIEDCFLCPVGKRRYKQLPIMWSGWDGERQVASYVLTKCTQKKHWFPK